jgi:hypothetical protein
MPTLGYASWEDNPREIDGIKAYYYLSDLVEKFRELEVFKSNGRFDYEIFSTGETLTLPINLTSQHLEKYEATISVSVNAILSLFRDDHYSADKGRIIRSVLIAALKQCDRTSRFQHFLTHLDEINSSIQHNYELFVSNFSFKDKKDELLEEKREYSNRLNSLVSTIQGKLLATPIALIVAVAGMKTEAKDNPEFVNLVILLGVSVFLVFMIFLLISHGSALCAIKADITNKRKRLECQVPNLFSDIKASFNSLERQLFFNEIFLLIVWVVLFTSYAFTWYSYIKITP